MMSMLSPGNPNSLNGYGLTVTAEEVAARKILAAVHYVPVAAGIFGGFPPVKLGYEVKLPIVQAAAIGVDQVTQENCRDLPFIGDLNFSQANGHRFNSSI